MKIEPIKVNIFDDIEVDYLKVTLLSDNLKDTCILKYTLCKESDPDFSPNNKSNYSGNLIVKNNDYLEWDGNNNFPYQYVINKLGLVPVKEKVIKEEAQTK